MKSARTDVIAVADGTGMPAFIRVAVAAAAIVVLTPSGAAHSQEYPAKAVRLVVGFPAGDGIDTVTRIVSTKLGEIWHQQIIVDNRPGAGGTLGAGIAAKASADGYTLLICTTATHAISPALYKKLPYEHIKDFAAVSMISVTANVLAVHPSVPVNSVTEFISHAKMNAGKITYGSAGVGSTLHLSMELLKTMTGIDVVHVPYKGGAPAVADLLGGHVLTMFGALPLLLPHVKAGKVRALGVSSAQRSLQLPNVPTIAEAGVPRFEVTAWQGICAPAAVPKPIITKLNADTIKTLNTTDVRQRLTDQGVEAAPSTSADFALLISAETTRWAKVIKDSGAKVD
jgi:tripartite-type tricarboxylate transporter receptor subunit TctC